MVISREKDSILVVDDAPSTLEVLKRNLVSHGFQVFIASNIRQGLKILESTPIDLVITDLKMPGENGLDLVKHIKENYKDTSVMMITGYATVEGAVSAVKMGAEEYLPKPFTEDELITAVNKVLDKLHLKRSSRTKPSTSISTPYGLMGKSDAMQKIFRAINKAAKTPATVLITGESGAGKELVARAIHYNSSRGSAPFVPVNCGGIPEGLLESELFGYVKGSFTGATDTRAGFFQTAEGGTIFLDEVSETSTQMQVKLLRVLQDKEIYMVGSTKAQKVDVRIIAATNKDLRKLVEKGEFREDLYFRLNVIAIDIPPLRERGDDILLLINHFATKFAEEYSKPVPRFSDKALQSLRNYHWPGNVRELENVIQRLIVMTEGEVIEVSDLPSLMRFSALRKTGLNRSLAEVEAEHIRNVMASVKGNKTHAAKILGIDRKTLRSKLKRYSIES